MYQDYVCGTFRITKSNSIIHIAPHPTGVGAYVVTGESIQALEPQGITLGRDMLVRKIDNGWIVRVTDEQEN
jgi:hypothetical protein